MPRLKLAQFLSTIANSPLADYVDAEPWLLTQRSQSIVGSLPGTISQKDFIVSDDIAVHPRQSWSPEPCSRAL